MNVGFVFEQLRLRHGDFDIMALLCSRYGNDVVKISTVCITNALPPDLLALVLGTYGYRRAAVLSRVCRAFQEAVKRVAFWRRGVRVEIAKYLPKTTIPVVGWHKLIITDFDPFLIPIPLHIACGWMFDKSKHINWCAGNTAGKADIGIGHHVRFTWRFDGRHFRVTWGDMNRAYSEKPNTRYNQIVLRDKGVDMYRESVTDKVL